MDERDAELVLDELQLELHLPPELEVLAPSGSSSRSTRGLLTRARASAPAAAGRLRAGAASGLEAVQVDELEDSLHTAGELSRTPWRLIPNATFSKIESAGTVRKTGRRCSRPAAVTRRRRDRRGRSSPTSAPRSPRSCGGSSSSRSRMGQSSAKKLPGSIVSETSSTATTSSKRFVTWSSLTSAAVSTPLPPSVVVALPKSSLVPFRPRALRTAHPPPRPQGSSGSEPPPP